MVAGEKVGTFERCGVIEGLQRVKDKDLTPNPYEELTSGGLIAKALRKAQDIVNCENVQKATILAV